MPQEFGVVPDCRGLEGVCTLDWGAVTLPGSPVVSSTADKQLTIINFTDPLCSACWAMEPAWRKFKLAYHTHFRVDYCMGGILPSWNNFNSRGIQRPEDAGRHWEALRTQFGMPLSASVWQEDPVASSYPACIVVKAALGMDREKGEIYLRLIREAVFMGGLNIGKTDILLGLATRAGLDPAELLRRWQTEGAARLEADLNECRRQAITGFPSLVFETPSGERQVIRGVSSFTALESLLFKLKPGIGTRATSLVAPSDWFFFYGSATVAEYAAAADLPPRAATEALERYYRQGLCERVTTAAGNLYIKHTRGYSAG